MPRNYEYHDGRPVAQVLSEAARESYNLRLLPKPGRVFLEPFMLIASYMDDLEQYFLAMESLRQEPDGAVVREHTRAMYELTRSACAKVARLRIYNDLDFAVEKAEGEQQMLALPEGVRDMVEPQATKLEDIKTAAQYERLKRQYRDGVSQKKKPLGRYGPGGGGGAGGSGAASSNKAGGPPPAK